MTSLVMWLGVDSRGPASLYLASDSRISWNRTMTWDYGRKLFASKQFPDVMGYCGVALFPSQVLSQIMDLIDGGLLFEAGDDPGARLDKVSRLIATSFEGYPENSSEFTIVHGTREGLGMDSAFHVFLLSRESGGWTRERLDLPTQSAAIRFLGSGREPLRRWDTIWSRTKEAGTSRMVFGAFCDALLSAEDPYTGGVPQLVGLYRKGPASDFGVLFKGQRHLLGLPAIESDLLSAVEWRNALFERCDWRTGQRLPGAQRHDRPRGLGRSQ